MATEVEEHQSFVSSYPIPMSSVFQEEEENKINNDEIIRLPHHLDARLDARPYFD